MQENETVVNRTLLIWCGIVIVEFFIIAQLMAAPAVVLFSLLMFWPVRAALNWPAPSADDQEQDNNNGKNTATDTTAS